MPDDRQAIRDGIDRARFVAQRIPSRWYTTTREGRPVVVDDTGSVVADLSGEWAPNMIRFFNAVSASTLWAMLSLIEELEHKQLPSATVRSIARLVGRFDVTTDFQPPRQDRARRYEA